MQSDPSRHHIGGIEPIYPSRCHHIAVTSVTPPSRAAGAQRRPAAVLRRRARRAAKTGSNIQVAAPAPIRAKQRKILAKITRKVDEHVADNLTDRTNNPPEPMIEPTKPPRRTRYVVIALLMVALAILFVIGKRALDIDSCLDRGGGWNYEHDDCEM
jgi:hypothetical protein